MKENINLVALILAIISLVGFGAYLGWSILKATWYMFTHLDSWGIYPTIGLIISILLIILTSDETFKKI